MVRNDFLAPNRLAVVIQGGDDGGAEHDIDAAAVAGGRWRGVAAAQVGEFPRAGRDDFVPESLAVACPKAKDMMFRVFLFRDAFGPVGDGHKNAAAPNNGTGLVLVAA